MSDDDKLFREEFEVISVGSDEYAFTIPTIKTRIIDTLPEREAYLDVGAGHGNLTRHFAPHFKRTVIVEPNPVLFDELMDWAVENGVSMSGENSAWEPHVTIDGAFDFAITSHVLYYVDPEARQDFVARMFRLLKPHGRLVIVTVAERTSEIGRLYQTFLPADGFQNIPFADELHQLVQTWGYQADYIPFHSDIRTQTEAEMEDVLNFLLLQRVDFTEPETNARRKTFIAENLTRKNSYSIASPGGIITLTK